MLEYRHDILKIHVPEEETQKIIEFGCGDQALKEILPNSRYTGVDIKEPADIIADLNDFDNISKLEIPTDNDIAIVGGLLEYLDEPFETLAQLRSKAKAFYILESKYEEVKDGWQKNFQDVGCEFGLYRIWNSIHTIFYGHHTFYICEHPKADKELML